VFAYFGAARKINFLDIGLRGEQDFRWTKCLHGAFWLVRLHRIDLVRMVPQGV
jgi:hypothetical protein